MFGGVHLRVGEGGEQPAGVSDHWGAGGAQAGPDGGLGGRRQGGLHQGQACPGRQLQLCHVHRGTQYRHDTQGPEIDVDN